MHGLKVNVTQCQAILFTREHITPLPIFLPNVNLSWSNQTTYLCVIIHKCLTFQTHFKDVNSKAVGRMKSSLPTLTFPLYQNYNFTPLLCAPYDAMPFPVIYLNSNALKTPAFAGLLSPYYIPIHTLLPSLTLSSNRNIFNSFWSLS